MRAYEVLSLDRPLILTIIMIHQIRLQAVYKEANKILKLLSQTVMSRSKQKQAILC